MKEIIIILGAGVMQGPAIEIAKELGFYTIAVDGSKEAPNISMADQFEQIDLKDKEGIETFAQTLQTKSSRLGIVTAGTDFSASVAWVAEKLELPGIPYEAALNASDKSRMRECFKKASLPSPEFYTITAKDNFYESSLKFPVVIKPVDNMGSRGCRRVDSIEEFPQAAKAAIDFSRSGRAIVENFMDGPEFSVDAICCHGEITICGLADRHIFFPPYFIEMGHTMPAVISEENQTAMLDTFCKGIHALGLAGEKNIGAAKGDIKLTSRGPMIGEIAARLSGGYMSGWTYPYSSGVQPIRAAILAAMGRKPDNLVPIKKFTCAERAFISIPGTVKQILNTENAKNIPNVKDLFLRIKKGDKVTFPENNVTKCGNILAAAETREEAINAGETAAKTILIHLDPADDETGKFLFFSPDKKDAEPKVRKEQRENLFPPDAFRLNDELYSELFRLPETFIGRAVKCEEPPSAPAKHGSMYLCAKKLRLIPFPAFTSSGLRDYMGRTAGETLDAVRRLTGLEIPVIDQEETTLQSTGENADNQIRLGRSFWAALIRGSYQGAVYYIENLGK